jgi:predicted AAA+ superfamily ATPase
MEAAPVVILEGGRAVGKSTTCRTVATESGWSAPLDLSDPGLIESIRLNPVRYLAELPIPTILDEAQLLPELPVWVKRVVDDRNGAVGQFILTGSARLGRHQLGGSDPLAGRSVRLRMWPMTPGERVGNLTPVAERLFDDDLPSLGSGRTVGAEWQRGGLPGLPGVLSPGDSPAWERAVGAYVEAVLPLGLSSSRVDQGRLLRAFRYLAANPGQQLNLGRMANDLQIKADTARSYLETLEACFLLFRAEAHRPAEHRVLTAHPRVYAGDVGLATWAARMADRAPTPLETGALLENDVAVALSATCEWGSHHIVVRHWRDERAKREVDLLLVHPDGRMVPIEVKAADRVGPADTAGLLAFAAANEATFHRGYLLYRGTRVVDLSPTGMPDRSIVAVPTDRLLHG